jgi:hypothetical protein
VWWVAMTAFCCLFGRMLMLDEGVGGKEKGRKLGSKPEAMSRKSDDPCFLCTEFLAVLKGKLLYW